MTIRRRTLTKLGLFLLAGAVVNVGVAWAVSLAGANGNMIEDEAQALAQWPRSVRSEWSEPEYRWTETRLGVTAVMYQGSVHRIDADGVEWQDYAFVVELRAGWPIRSMALRREFERGERSFGGYLKERIFGGFRLSEGGTDGDWGMLPVRPLLIGFAGNTGFFAGGLACGAVGWSSLRSRRRRARGLCPRCKYDIADRPTCPECGETIRRTAATA